ncbi:CLUMA_CG013219, isoform A [Clunio marinus]|uniref:CLUMA_CG013219, isoform A n=1 Tax=Clunio marinus TaxID=568069 RepID=A0A1J1IK45_9DIPT|nr:CLUMA_CG013219, isoform A [Clunio marinus]
MKFLILIAVLCVVSAQCSEDCSKVKCPPAPKHYEEFGCTPIVESGKCCPARFDCSSLENRDKTKCHYNNETYELNQEVKDQSIQSSCTIGCVCRQFPEDSPPHFECGHIDCPEFFVNDDEHSGKECIEQYENDSCCASKTVCGADLLKLDKCVFQGQTYYEGQSIDAEGSCYSCHCGKGFEDKPVEENKHCKKINCNIEIHYSGRFARGCVPIYWKTDSCCPIDWRCPDDKKTKVIADSSRTQKEGDADLQCTFGGLKMNLGDFLSPERDDDQCTICTCKVPPFPHCIKTC